MNNDVLSIIHKSFCISYKKIIFTKIDHYCTINIFTY